MVKIDELKLSLRENHVENSFLSIIKTDNYYLPATLTSEQRTLNQELILHNHFSYRRVGVFYYFI